MKKIFLILALALLMPGLACARVSLDMNIRFGSNEKQRVLKQIVIMENENMARHTFDDGAYIEYIVSVSQKRDDVVLVSFKFFDADAQLVFKDALGCKWDQAATVSIGSSLDAFENRDDSIALQVTAHKEVD